MSDYVKFSLVVFCLAFFSLPFSLARASFSSSSFQLENPINFIGGGFSTSSNFQYISTTGQLTQGQSSSNTFAQNAGFLYFPGAATPTPPPPSGGGGRSGRNGLIYGNCALIADFNCDGYVNIFDLSILLYYLNHPIILDPFDLSGDGKIDLVDISILFYYWHE